MILQFMNDRMDTIIFDHSNVIAIINCSDAPIKIDAFMVLHNPAMAQQANQLGFSQRVSETRVHLTKIRRVNNNLTNGWFSILGTFQETQ